MPKQLVRLTTLCFLAGAFAAAAAPARPNILFIIADDASPHFGQAYGCAWVKTPNIDRVPRIWPDNDVVRRDMLDYAVEVEAFDGEVGTLLQALDASGEASNTLVIVTSDNGMPFPRSKGHNYDIANREPLVACWPAGIVRPGRRVAEFVSFIDLAPTFLDLLGVDGAKAGLSPITGRSFANLLRGEADPSRTFVILGRERNDVQARPGTPSGLGYPVRAIREGDLFYIHNFEPDRWPCGNIELGLLDTDAGPTKSFIRELGEKDRFWQMSFGKRPPVELFNLSKDPDCINNLANDATYATQATALREKLFAELKKQSDPRGCQASLLFHSLNPATGKGNILFSNPANGEVRADGTYDMMYSCARKVDGPWTPRRVAVPHAGHGALFQDKSGRWNASFFGNDRTAPFRATPGFVPVEVTDAKDDLIISPANDR